MSKCDSQAHGATRSDLDDVHNQAHGFDQLQLFDIEEYGEILSNTCDTRTPTTQSADRRDMTGRSGSPAEAEESTPSSSR